MNRCKLAQAARGEEEVEAAEMAEAAGFSSV